MVGAASCGSDRSGGPKGAPTDVVRRATDATIRAGSAQFIAQSQNTVLDGVLDLATGAGRGRLHTPGESPANPVSVPLAYDHAYDGTGVTAASGALLTGPRQLIGLGVVPGNPLVALDLLRGATSVDSIGGAAMRGVSTIHYELVVNPERAVAAAPADRRAALSEGLTRIAAVAIPAEVWIDSANRVRRIQLGDDLARRTFKFDSRGIPFVTTIDFFDFSPRGTT